MTILRQQIELQHGGLKLILCHDGTVFLPDLTTLLVADLHLGKEHSFRAQQIPVPNGPTQSTLDLLTFSLNQFVASHLIVLGDLIHDRNSMTQDLIQRFARWRNSQAQLDITLVRGNHDRNISKFPESWKLTEEAKLKLCVSNAPNSDALNLVHQAPAEPGEQSFVEGHWHPVTNIGRGADRTRVRCFVIKGKVLTLPAFGPFKGGTTIDRRSATLYPLLKGHIFSMS